MKRPLPELVEAQREYDAAAERLREAKHRLIQECCIYREGSVMRIPTEAPHYAGRLGRIVGRYVVKEENGYAWRLILMPQKKGGGEILRAQGVNVTMPLEIA